MVAVEAKRQGYEEAVHFIECASQSVMDAADQRLLAAVPLGTG